MKMVDMTNQVFGSMTVLGFSHTHNTRAFWMCRCVCGIEKPVSGKHLRAGQVVSCGCMKGPKTQYADYGERRKELRQANPEKSRKWLADYRARNRDEYLSRNRQHSSKQRLKRRNLHSVPPWSQAEQISTVYQKAREFGMEVDHIVPLVSEKVCGLHVWDNLQLLVLQENRRKSNQVWPDMPDPRRLSNAELQGITS